MCIRDSGKGDRVARTRVDTREHAVCATEIDGGVEGRALDAVDDDATDVASKGADEIDGEGVRDGTLGRVALERGGDGGRLHGADPDGKHEVIGDILAVFRDTQGDDRWHGKEADDERFDCYQYHCAPPFERHVLIIDNLTP